MRATARGGRRPTATGARAWLLASLLVLCTLPAAPVADAAPATAGAPAGADGAALAEVPSFSDVGPGHPFGDEIAWAAANAITTGYADGTFRGGAAVTRQAFAAFLARYWVSPGVPATCAAAPFPDVPTTQPFCPQISWLKARGLATGYPDGTFRPAATITRQALAVFLYRFRGAPRGGDPTCDAKPAVDVPVGHAFCGEIAWFADVGLTTATPTTAFNPAAATSRQASVTFLHRLDPGCAPTTEPTGGCPRPAVPGDYDGDRTADPMWNTWDLGSEDPPEVAWRLGGSSEPAAVAPPAAQVVDGDYDGDGRWETAYVQAPTGDWTTTGGAGTVALPSGCPDLTVSPGFVLRAIPVPGDWDGDRTTDPAWYCPTTGIWSWADGDPLAFGAAHDPDDPTYSHDVPAPADYDGDGTTDVAVYRPRDGSWWVHGDSEPIATGLGIGVPTPADLDGDGADEPVLYITATSTFEVPGQGDVASPAPPSTCGEDTGIPGPADYDGDGAADLAAIEGGAFAWQGTPPTTVDLAVDVCWGWPSVLGASPWTYVHMVFMGRACQVGDADRFDARRCPRIAVPGDLDGDRRADLAWYDELGIGLRAVGDAEVRPGPVAGCTPASWTEEQCGSNVGLPGDWDGDGDWELGAYRPDTGEWVAPGVAVALSAPDCPLAEDPDGGTVPYTFAIPVPGAWDTDWATDPAWYCPSSGTWHFEDGSVVTFGRPAPHRPDWLGGGDLGSFDHAWHDQPLAFDLDGDGLDEPTVYRPTDGTLRDAGGVVGAGIGLGIPLRARLSDGNGDGLARFVPAAGGAPHRFVVDGPVEVDLGSGLTRMVPAMLDLDGDGIEAPAGIATDDPSTTHVFWASGVDPTAVTPLDGLRALPSTAPATAILADVTIRQLIATCAQPDIACPVEIEP